MKKVFSVLTIILFLLLIELNINTNVVNANTVSSKYTLNVDKPNKLIVEYKSNQTNANTKIKSLSTVESIKNINEKISVIEPKSEVDKQNLLINLKLNPNVKSVEEDKKLKICSTPNDADYGEQWYLPNINYDKLLNYNIVTKKSATVAVIDTGINYNHEDLQGVIADGGYNFYADSTNVYDDNGHGTEVSGIIVAKSNNQLGIAGIVSNVSVKILPLKAADSQGDSTLSDMLSAVDYAISQKVDVINISMGSNDPSDIENQEIQKAISNGIVVIGAAGNDGNSSYTYPASYDNVISVGATDQSNSIAYFSNHNNKVSLCAPGKDILTTDLDGEYSYCSGTSFSTPIISAMAALVKSANPDLNPSEIKQILQNSTTDLGTVGVDDYYGYGKIDADKCINNVLAPKTILLSPSSFDLNVNATHVLSATINPDNSIDKNIIWSSSNQSVATVDQSGAVKGIAKGQAIITAKTELGGVTSASNVNVLDSDEVNVKYEAHVQNIGWQAWKSNWDLAGTEGQGLRMEALKVNLENAPSGAKIKYQVHIQNVGWQDWKYDGNEAGTDGKSLRIEAIRIVLENASGYSVAYQAHVQNVGWQDTVYDGQLAGTTGQGLKIEALRIKIVKTSSVPMGVSYSSHVQNIGWQSSVRDNEMAGTQGLGYRMEALKINLVDAPSGAKIKYQTHVQNIGWQDWVYDGSEAGSDGNGLRVEAVKISLENAPGYSVAYQVQVQNIGWQDWVYDGAMAGTTGKSLRVEAIRIKIVKKS